MHLFAITGMRHASKAALVQALVEQMSKQTDRVMLIDNSDVPLTLDQVTKRRLMGGCVCCSLASALIPLVWRLEADYAVMPVSSAADPETLSRILDSLQGTHITITTIALIDDHTRTTHPYLAKKLAFYAHHAFYEPFDAVALTSNLVLNGHLL